MRKNEIIKNYGESFVAMMFTNWGYESDIIDAEGIDLMCYKEISDNSYKKYGISVKTRDPYDKMNNSLNLTWNDLVLADKQAKVRDGELLYAIVWYSIDRVDVVVFSQEYVLKKFGYSDIEGYKKDFPKKPKPKESNGSTKSISTNLNARNSWLNMYKEGEPGVIYAARFDINDNNTLTV